jgi:hypothetical protein
MPDLTRDMQPINHKCTSCQRRSTRAMTPCRRAIST